MSLPLAPRMLMLRHDRICNAKTHPGTNIVTSASVRPRLAITICDWFRLYTQDEDARRGGVLPPIDDAALAYICLRMPVEGAFSPPAGACYLSTDDTDDGDVCTYGTQRRPVAYDGAANGDVVAECQVLRNDQHTGPWLTRPAIECDWRCSHRRFDGGEVRLASVVSVGLGGKRAIQCERAGDGAACR